MTVPNNKIKESFNGDDITVLFPFTGISFYAVADLDVLIAAADGTETVLTQNTDYTITNCGTGMPYTYGDVTMIGYYALHPPATGETVVVYRDVPYTQEIDLVAGGAMPAATLEEGYDRGIMQIQQLFDQIGRTVTLPISSPLTGLTLPSPEALLFLRWNALADNLENMDIASIGALSVSPYWESILDETSLAASLTALGLAADLATFALPASTTISAFIKTLLDDADAAAARATLEVGSWTPVTAFTATPPLTVVGVITFTFAASTSVVASADCAAQGVKPGMMIFNSTDDTRTAAKRILSISADGLTITLAAAYAGTTGAAKAGTIFGRTLTMTSDLTASMPVNTPLKYTIGGTVYYGIVNTIAAALLTVDGAPLSGDVTALSFGDPTRVIQIDVIIPGLYEDADNTALITSDLASNLTWDKVKSYLVRYRVYSAVHDSGATHGKASVIINATEVNTATDGLVIAANTTWYSTGVDLDTAAYDINPGELLEVTAKKGTTGDGSDLTTQMTLVIP